MFAIEVRDTIMVAHSLPDPLFGPAAGKHGATFVVDVAFFTESLTQAKYHHRHRPGADRPEVHTGPAALQGPRYAADVRWRNHDRRISLPIYPFGNECSD